MKKQRKIFTLITLLIIILRISACGKENKSLSVENDVRANIEPYLNNNETVISIEVLEREQNPKRNATAICKVNTSANGINYTKFFTAKYVYYEKTGMTFSGLSEYNLSEWTASPERGIDEANLTAYLNGFSITTHDEAQDTDEIWYINDNLSDISIESHNTDLDNGKDTVIINITIDDYVQQASGQIIADFSFTQTANGWEWVLDNISNNEEFTVSEKAESALDLSDNDLINVLNGKTFYYNGAYGVSLTADSISDLIITETATAKKGTEKTYSVSFTLTKPNAVFDCEATIVYHYDSQSGWIMSDNIITGQTKSIDIAGVWKGIYENDAFTEGDVSLEISSIDESGNITGIFSFNEIDATNGSYNVSGTIDMNSLSIHLYAGDWIVESQFWLDDYGRRDISAVFNAETSEIIGEHASTDFTLKKQ